MSGVEETVPRTRKYPFLPEEYGDGFLEDKLAKYEIFWRDLYPWLKESGYLLRPRYSPGWSRPWGDNGRPSDFEESSKPWSASVMDATRTSDGSYVALKRSEPPEGPEAFGGQEIELLRQLSSEPLASDVHNRCIRPIEILRVPDEIQPHVDLIVMPLLFTCERYPFSTIGEVVDFFTQAFEGLKFIHSQNIWHGDCKFNSIMMDASPILQDDPHPWVERKTRDWSKAPLPTRSRTQHPVKYYWIDYDLSGKYDPSTGPPLTDPGYGGIHTVPEWAFPEQKCNPFAVDVWCLAYTIRGWFTEGFELDEPHKVKGLEFMHGLLADMSQDDPANRPTMDVVVDRFTRIRAGLSEWKLRSRFTWEKRFFLLEIPQVARHWAQQLSFVVKRIPAIPSAV
ncbi:kinase-like domain-containing protein [Mycena metata]|uniref:Kinase-like domain-containing protein n=1 Tax=Mycena metata TaxID=1033252 RepID=A0AAD7HPM8_9AGAR|nr:kinase-like domain-containing protein [Mycena metata]KAJ7724559.1 kinase-like domain-containing protein [Mycena metata]